ncbi:MAG: HAMP domain-containing histidine kinase, partial [Candidatus Omnitrophica bacterium]|nr:HAMP domain-containing histidine kinase [Candidatus Omnitrophota bacterium]
MNESFVHIIGYNGHRGNGAFFDSSFEEAPKVAPFQYVRKVIILNCCWSVTYYRKIVELYPYALFFGVERDACLVDGCSIFIIVIKGIVDGKSVDEIRLQDALFNSLIQKKLGKKSSSPMILTHSLFPNTNDERRTTKYREVATSPLNSFEDTQMRMVTAIEFFYHGTNERGVNFLQNVACINNYLFCIEFDFEKIKDKTEEQFKRYEELGELKKRVRKTINSFGEIRDISGTIVELLKEGKDLEGLQEAFVTHSLYVCPADAIKREKERAESQAKEKIKLWQEFVRGNGLKQLCEDFKAQKEMFEKIALNLQIKPKIVEDVTCSYSYLVFTFKEMDKFVGHKYYFRAVDIRALLEEAMEDYKNACSIFNIKLSPIKGVKRLPLVDGEAKMLLMAIKRVYSNSLYYLKKKIKEKKIKAPRIDTFLFREKNGIRIEIPDNAGGIPLEMKEKIFILGQSSKLGGSGVGCNFLKQVVEDHGGKVWEEGSYGEGVKFIIKLPGSNPVLNSPQLPAVSCQLIKGITASPLEGKGRCIHPPKLLSNLENYQQTSSPISLLHPFSDDDLLNKIVKNSILFSDNPMIRHLGKVATGMRLNGSPQWTELIHGAILSCFIYSLLAGITKKKAGQLDVLWVPATKGMILTVSDMGLIPEEFSDDIELLRLNKITAEAVHEVIKGENKISIVSSPIQLAHSSKLIADRQGVSPRAKYDASPVGNTLSLTSSSPTNYAETTPSPFSEIRVCADRKLGRHFVLFSQLKKEGGNDGAICIESQSSATNSFVLAKQDIKQATPITIGSGKSVKFHWRIEVWESLRLDDPARISSPLTDIETGTKQVRPEVSHVTHFKSDLECVIEEMKGAAFSASPVVTVKNEILALDMDVIEDSFWGKDPEFVKRQWQEIICLAKRTKFRAIGWHNTYWKKVCLILSEGLRGRESDNILQFHTLNFTSELYIENNSRVLSNLAKEVINNEDTYGYVGGIENHAVFIFSLGVLEGWKKGTLNDCPKNFTREFIGRYPERKISTLKLKVLDLRIDAKDVEEISLAYYQSHKDSYYYGELYFKVLCLKSIWLDRLADLLLNIKENGAASPGLQDALFNPLIQKKLGKKSSSPATFNETIQYAAVSRCGSISLLSSRGLMPLIFTNTIGWFNSLRSKAISLLFAVNSGSFSISNAIRALSGSLRVISSWAMTKRSNSVLISRDFSKYSLSVIFNLLQKLFLIKFPVRFYIVQGKSQSIAEVLDAVERSFSHFTTGRYKVFMRKTMRRIIAKNWPPTISIPNFQLHGKLCYPFAYSAVIMPATTIYPQVVNIFSLSELHKIMLSLVFFLVKKKKGFSPILTGLRIKHTGLRFQDSELSIQNPRLSVYYGLCILYSVRSFASDNYYLLIIGSSEAVIEEGSLGFTDSITSLLSDYQTSQEILFRNTGKKIFDNGDDVINRKEMYSQENDSTLGGNRITQDIAEISIAGNKDERVFVYGFVDFLVRGPGVNVPNINDVMSQGFKMAGDASGTISVNEEFHLFLVSVIPPTPRLWRTGSYSQSLPG